MAAGKAAAVMMMGDLAHAVVAPVVTLGNLQIGGYGSRVKLVLTPRSFVSQCFQHEIKVVRLLNSPGWVRRRRDAECCRAVELKTVDKVRETLLVEVLTPMTREARYAVRVLEG
nr:hypothetical protein B0A51_13098 [Rachicladosporium sp. CCFEE 5018]